MEKAVGVLMELSADERTRMLAEAREKARRDEVSRLNRAKREGREEGEKRGVQIGEMKIIELLKSGKTPEDIIREYGAD
jgi:flagellar biosynthesis/type III secretory pathway protein FliH